MSPEEMMLDDGANVQAQHGDDQTRRNPVVYQRPVMDTQQHHRHAWESPTPRVRLVTSRGLQREAAHREGDDECIEPDVHRMGGSGFPTPQACKHSGRRAQYEPSETNPGDAQNNEAEGFMGELIGVAIGRTGRQERHEHAHRNQT